MSTLIFNGSPRKNGDTVSLLNVLERDLPDCIRINAYTAGISPCVDCRYCWQHQGCATHDGWGEIDRLLRECDSIVIASPIYFSELTGALLSLLSRLQQYYCAMKFRGEPYPLKGKRGGVVLVGGGDGKPDRAEQTAKTLLHSMGCKEIYPTILCHDTNRKPALQEEDITTELNRLALFLNGKEELP